MSDKILISKVGLYETIRCTICENPIKTERGCNGSCKYNEEMLSKIIDAVEGLAEERPHENWEYLKEHITEMRDADGKLNQKQTCQFILNLMGVIEKEGDRNDV